ncbi:hypothetical protein [Salinigranum salinum]|uniref:hypothetical protein n=1 Tax=Salinigranum salinum TaxID=1364937 RepID=UPI00126137C8|nr:hypothetical protein [Salinigranum salinum]
MGSPDVRLGGGAGRDLDFELADVVCRTQAPPPLVEIAQQRRRWAAGNHADASRLPFGCRLLIRVRNYAWALSPVVTAVTLPLTLTGAVVISDPFLRFGSMLLGALTASWYARGALWYRRAREERSVRLLAALPLLPLVSLVHPAGTAWGLVDPLSEFRVTTKTT